MLLAVSLLLVCAFSTIVADNKVDLKPGHLKPFGEGRPSHPVEEVEGYINPEEFFTKYVKPLKPVKFKGAAKLSPAFTKWTDDYFLAQDEPEDNVVSVETKKKEDRKQGTTQMSFKDFVKTYNNSENYMVDSVPVFIREDVMVPCPLQCPTLMYEGLVENIMWYSSGGTKSVIHTDSVQNINCLLRGDKSLVFVDPTKYGDKVPLDHPEGAYSSIDVDSVDYHKYPGLAEVEFLHVKMVPGDCLYIPYKWIHQVRSFGSNLAVNIWWKHDLGKELDFEECNSECDHKLSLADVNFQHFDSLEMKPEEIREHLHALHYEKQELNFHEFLQAMFGEEMVDLMKENKEEYEEKKKLFSEHLDPDKDGVIKKEDIDKFDEKELAAIGQMLLSIEKSINEQQDWNEEDGQEGNEQAGDMQKGNNYGMEVEGGLEMEPEDEEGRSKYFGDSQFPGGEGADFEGEEGEDFDGVLSEDDVHMYEMHEDKELGQDIKDKKKRADSKKKHGGEL